MDIKDIASIHGPTLVKEFNIPSSVVEKWKTGELEPKKFVKDGIEKALSSDSPKLDD